MSSIFAKPTGTPFGQSAALPFGQTTTNTNTGSGLFGQQSQPQNQQQQQTGTNSFGTSSLFNQPQQQQQQTGTNAFGTSSSFNKPQQPQHNLQQLAQSGFINQSQMQQPTQRTSLLWEEGRDSPTQKPVTAQMEEVFEKWNPASPNTVFKYHFYNQVDKAKVPFFGPDPRETQREWEEAVRNRPSKDVMPALATGFKQLGIRLEMQKGVLGQFNIRLHQINSCLDGILSKHDLQTSVRAMDARRKHAHLRARCLKLACKVQTLRNRGYALDADEDELKTKLETLERGMIDPALSARAEELWSRLIILRAQADQLKKQMQNKGGDASDVLPEEAEIRAKKILEDYDKQLQALRSNVEKVKEDYDEWEKERNPDLRECAPIKI